MDLTPLDNAVWSALTSLHQPLARGGNLARRYPGDVSPLSALRQPSSKAFDEMRLLLNADEKIGITTPQPIDIPADWEVHRSMPLDQMICLNAPPEVASPKFEIIELKDQDVPEMLALTAATEPGPFLPNTIRMGPYYGIRVNKELAAMAGVRLQLTRFTEISAVCTAPHYRGRGYAAALVSMLANQIHRAGRIPFLHVLPDNPAKSVYQKLGFTLRWTMRINVISAR